MRQTTLVLLLVFGCWAPALAQRNVQDSTITSTHVAMTFGGYIPLGDLQDRFGGTAQLGVNLARKSKQGWYYGINFGYNFGEDVTEPGLLQNLLNDEGHILANDGRIAEVNVGMRGYYLGLEGGRVFNVVGPIPTAVFWSKVGQGTSTTKFDWSTNTTRSPSLKIPTCKATTGSPTALPSTSL